MHEKLLSVHLTPAHPHSSLGTILKVFLVDRLESEHHSGLDENIPNRHKSSAPEARCLWVILDLYISFVVWAHL